MKTAIKAIILISCLAAITLLTYRIHGSPKVGIDDANIFFSYAENMAAGNGITYGHNPDRVEGFTSMLWLLICALIFSLGLDESTVRIVSVLLVLITQWILLHAIQHCTVERRQRAWPYQCVYLVLLLSSPSYITWMTITLMDTCLWGLFIAGMTYVVLSPPVSPRGQIMAALPFVIAPLSRPEGMLVAPVLVGLLWLRSQSTGWRSQTRFCIGAGCVLLLILATLTVFRLMYFGFPLPNTYYAKVSPSLAYNLREGKGYLHQFVLSGTIIGGSVAVVLLVAASWFGRSVDSMRSGRSLRSLLMSQIKASEVTALAAFVLLLVPVLTGGDHLGMFRFYQPVYPLLCMTLALLLSESCTFELGGARQLLVLGGRNVFKIVAVGIVLAYWLFTYSFSKSWSSMRFGAPIAHEFRIAETGMAQGTTLKTLFAKCGRFPSVGVTAAGGIARTYPGPLVDLMGLNNRCIAHFKGDRKGMKNHAAFEKGAFFHVEPDVLLASPPIPPEISNFYSVCLKGLFEDPRFIAGWCYGVLSLNGDSGCSATGFVNRAFLDNMLPKSALEFRHTMIWSNRWVEVTDLPGRQN